MITSSQYRLLTIPDIAERDQVNEKTVRRWIQSGDLIAHKLGAQWRVTEDDHALFLRERRGLNLRGSGDQR
jgi:excisionase family DNA binding protein